MTVEISQVAVWASIASPIIAVIIAVWSGVSSRRATAKQLAAIEESTAKQVDAMIKVANTQIEVSKLQLDAELWDAENKFSQKMDESKYAGERHSSMLGVPMNEYTMHINAEREKEDKLSSELNYYAKRKIVLTSLKDRLKAIDILFNKD